MAKISILFLLTAALGCTQADKVIKNIERIDFQYNKVFIDTVFLSPTVYSGEGSLNILKDSIYLFDPLIGVIHTFNIDGTLEGRHLGFGGGPMELDGGIFILFYQMAVMVFFPTMGIGFTKRITKKKDLRK